ncbi:hypothetical protein GCM10023149_40180 [Mucilaginibacter gynuensis]|uniref:DUF4412 domain-containing protein n=1 Tax=Mucilaginibacter gynuensis TaxID=1302236 RepID=A0ABP8H2D4_9SPHI
MNIKFFSAALGLALTATVMSASAQKEYKEGVITYTIESPQGTIDAKTYFKGDSSAYSMQQGPADIKFIGTNEGTFFAVLVDVPVASIKKAAIATPAELEDFKSKSPDFTFTPTTETKVINGFKCKKVTVKDTKSGSNYDAWVTNDITIPTNMMSTHFKKAGGIPVQFTTLQMGQAININLKSITGDKVPAGIFAIPADFEKVTISDLKAMGGGGN